MLATPRILVAIAAGVATVAAKRYLPPGPINAGYVGGECNETQIMHAVQTGLNVLFWFSINLVDRGGAPAVQGGPNVTCVRSVMATLASRGLNTTHMISVGGWNAPHPTTRFPAAAVYAAWAKWNAALAPGGLYDGVDWDLEGNDDVASPYNTFAAPVLDLVGQFSQLAQADGFVVTLVPPESYLDPVTAPTYNRSLLFDYPDGWQPAFKYHGRNAYALLLAKYGTTTTPTAAVPTFDLVMIQLYESYSHADFNVTARGQAVADYLESWVPTVTAGWFLEFARDPTAGVPSQAVRVPPSQLVIGLANGWAGGAKTILMMPADVGAAYASLQARGLAPRGFVFWTITEEGDVPHGQAEPLFMAAGINAFLHTRP